MVYYSFLNPKLPSICEKQNSWLSAGQLSNPYFCHLPSFVANSRQLRTNACPISFITDLTFQHSETGKHMSMLYIAHGKELILSLCLGSNSSIIYTASLITYSPFQLRIIFPKFKILVAKIYGKRRPKNQRSKKVKISKISHFSKKNEC